MIFINQFRIIFWKNWKLFKKRSSLFFCAFEIFYTFVLIGTLSIRHKIKYYDEPIPNSIPEYPEFDPEVLLLNNNVMSIVRNEIAFVINNNQTDISKEEFVSSIMKDEVLSKIFKGKSHIFNDETEFEQYTLQEDYKNTIMCLIIFNQSYTNYTIRTQADAVINPDENPIWEEGCSPYELMYNRIFIFIQMAIDNAILQWKTNHAIDGYRINIGILSKHSYTDRKSYQREFDGLAPYILFICIGQFFHISNRLMEEKESGTRDGLIAIGAHPFLMWFTWHIIYTPQFLAILIIFMLFDPSLVFRAINPILFGILIIAYAFSMFNLSVIISTVIKKTRTILVFLCLFIAFMISFNKFVFSLKMNGYSTAEKIISYIFSPVGVSMASEEINYTGDHYQYIGFNNIFQTEFGKYFIAVLSNCLIYFLLAVALSYIRKIDFQSCFIRSFHIKKQISNSSSSDYPYPNDIQEDPTGMECFVEVRNLYKFFKFRRNIGSDIDDDDTKLGKTFAANNNVSFRVYKDEIFAILGHNGAGKSTLIQNMVGIYHPDSGETFYRGIPLSSNKKRIQLEMGICLQNNVLIEGFTVADHFKLYAGIKGASATEADLEAWLEEIDLVSKKNFEVQKMSGGQKRKLCIGLALIGHPKYVFLDEPTTGLDPLSRRKIWSLLLKVKKNRVIFITTHYMDEADIIADRKLIMNRGSIRCLGTSVYLKSHFNMKYSLEVETTDPKYVGQLIQRHIPESTSFHNKTKTGYHLNKEIKEFDITHNSFKNDHDQSSNNCMMSIYTWKLPIQASSHFSALLEELEKEREVGSTIHNFSLNAPLLEELFVGLEKEIETHHPLEQEQGRDIAINCDNINNQSHTFDGNTNNLNLSSLNVNEKAIELPQIDKIVRPSIFNAGFRLAKYRIRVYLRQKTYFFMAILVPFAIMCILLPQLNEQLKKIGYTQYSNFNLTPDIYKNMQWNYDIKNSSLKMINEITPELLQRELPSRQDGLPSLDLKTQKEVENLGLEGLASPYYVSSISGEKINNLYDFIIFYNESLIHSLPTTLNVISNSILAANHSNDTIHTHSHPFTFYNSYQTTSIKLTATLVITFCIAFPLSFYGTNVVRERAKNLLKQLQLNGLSNDSYWISVLITDLLVFLVTCLIIFSATVICHFTLFYHSTIILAMLFFIPVCGIACLFFQYCVSYIFEREANAFIIFFVFNILPPYAITIKAFTDNIESDSTGRLDIVLYLAVLIIGLSAVFPCYGFVRVIRSLLNLGIKNNITNYPLTILNIFSFRNQITSCFIGCLLATTIYYKILKYLTRKRYNPKKKVFPTSLERKELYDNELQNGDDDVLQEYERVQADEKNNQIPIKICQLAKEYDEIEFESRQEIIDAFERKNPKYGEFHLSELGNSRVVMTAFENITLGVDKCECFGILGPNGSGKSSLLNTTSFTFPQTLGKIYYDGKDTTERIGNEIIIGYCPQEDTLWNEFTLLEHIEMFLYLRGYNLSEAHRIAKEFISNCHLTEHKNKMPHELSGGTRRKLNILIALCCSSSKIIMDEPSAGMDPFSRRYIWDIIKATLQNQQSSIIMSTHSMEEAELLCNRIAIMIDGRIRCIGTPEHLKMKFGNTYILEVQTNDVEKFHDEVVEKRQLFGDTEYIRENKSLQRVKYEVKSIYHIGNVFRIMEECRDIGLYTDYSYSQTSLEQIFLNYAMRKSEMD